MVYSFPFLKTGWSDVDDVLWDLEKLEAMRREMT
jgi:hypothetical protein